jgi:hypothetical protein
MTFDSQRNKTVLFGGRDLTSDLGDTWEWDGIIWTQVADIGPYPRHSHSMVFNSGKNKSVLFGGVDYNYQNVFHDTWVWDGKFWTQRQDIGPQKALHSMAYDSDRNHVVIFGGANNITALSDTWELKVEIYPQ